MSKEKVSAADIAKKMNLKKVYENSKGEFFTHENLALESEKHDKEKVKCHDFSGGVNADDTGKKAAEKADREAAKAKEALIDKINKAKTAEDVDALVGESGDADVASAALSRKDALAGKGK